MIKRIFRAVKRRSSKKDAFYGFLVKLLGRKPKNVEVYRLAFRHKSASLYEDGKKINNERLEYLGDAILDAVVADMLFQKFPNQKEGFLTKLRSRLVSRKYLNKLGRKMRLQEYLVANGRIADNVFGNCVEAFIGAIYLDFGFERTKKIVVERFIEGFSNYTELLEKDENYKSRFVEWGQSQRKEVAFESEEGIREKRPYFYSKALLDGVVVGEGEGTSKKQSQQIAAEKALKMLKK
ncbi:MAG: ribonuclease III [Flavobacteriaceae bacterium]|nr:ribonuclease III [Flavobacteriaceae bacterium]